MKTSVRIGCASAFWGDTQTAARQLVEHGDLDYLVFDYLAEVTLSIMLRQRMKNPQAGFARDFIDPVMRPLLPAIKRQGIRVLSNAGGLNPQACAQALQEAAQAQGIELKVAVVLGDDVRHLQDELRAEGAREMFSDTPMPEQLITMNAYLGAGGLKQALDAGADVVITGRIVDSAVTLAPLMHEFSWSEDDYDRLAAGGIAGHIIECGAQCTGGNFTDWESVPGYENMGFPVVECFADGRFLVSKPPNTGGLVTPLTVGEQMLYEIGDPGCYLLPDVTCDFRSVELTQVGPDLVEVSGCRGRSPSSSYKVSALYPDQFRVTTTLLIGGMQAPAKARRAAEAILTKTRGILEQQGWGDFSEVCVETLGAESIYGPHSRRDDTREVVLKIAAKHTRKEALEVLTREMPQAATGMVPGVTGYFGGRASVTPIPRLYSTLVAKNKVPVRLQISDEEVAVPVPPGDDQLAHQAPVIDAGGHWNIDLDQPLTEVPLMTLAVARSGDKGDKANIGVMARKPQYFPWIAHSLSAEAVRDWFAYLLADNAGVHRYVLPGTHALNFLLDSALGGGGVASLRIDPQGKCLGQILLEHPVQVPEKLL
nr:DUF1446 domain-containing protein [Oceanococcus sp. HetDA_MAG_MS8]